MIDYILPYIPDILQAVLTGLLMYIVKIIASKTEKLKDFKESVLNKVESNTTYVSDSVSSAQASVNAAISEMKDVVKEIKDTQELVTKYAQNEAELKALISKYDKRLVEIEALLRKE